MKLNKAQDELVKKIVDSLEQEDLIWRKGWHHFMVIDHLISNQNITTLE